LWFDFLDKIDKIDKIDNISVLSISLNGIPTIMKTVTSGKVQASFGEVADIAKGGEPVIVTQYGRPTLILMRYQDGIEAVRAGAGNRLMNWMDARAADAPSTARTDTVKDIDAIINE
jgi:antitoxin (DNA-binding transcriptional repressor) of toxin-antitoxin stability system